MPNATVTVNAEFSMAQTQWSISTEEQLFNFAATVNGGAGELSAVLTQNIVLTQEWIPIGLSDETPFSGVFDGGGYTVSGLTITNDSCVYAGLFGCAQNAEIKNLTVRGNINCGSSNYSAGGVVGFAIFDNTITNCTSYVSINGISYAGGIAGVVYRGVVTSCTNYGSVTSNGTASGIVSTHIFNYDMEISKCINYGAIVSTGTMASEIVGDAGTKANISECTNKGNVSVTYTNGPAASGIVASSGDGLKVLNCYNTGDITVNSNPSRLMSDSYIGGILGENTGEGIIITNCYNTGIITKNCSISEDYQSEGARYGEIAPTKQYAFNGTSLSGLVDVAESTCKLVNCYSPNDDFSASALGDAFIEDENGVNVNNTPLLKWENSVIDSTEYHVIINTNPAEAKVLLYSDSAMQKLIPPANDGYYSLANGNYYFSANCDGYVTANGSFLIANGAQTVSVTLSRGVPVSFRVSPGNAKLTLTDGENKLIAPDSSNGGDYSFTLLADSTYTYTATAAGFNGTTREITAPFGDTIVISLTPTGQVSNNKTISGGGTISEGGDYNVTSGATGIITITTSQPVTLIGSGVSNSDTYRDLHIKYTLPGVNLTLQDIYISNTAGSTNMIDFTGSNNYLYFKGTSILDTNTNATGYAMIHVNQDTELTVSGVSDSDSLYFYKREQGAGIGGNGGASGGEGQSAETNGAITIVRGNFFMKNSKQGALIGAGAQAGTQKPGPITIQGGVLNLIAISRGSAIGGSAGSGGASSGSDVYMHGGTLNIHIDWSGAAIGGGGHDGGNDSDGGTLHYFGGSIRTYIGENAVGQWKSFGVTQAGMNEAAITADKFNGDSTDSVHRLVLNTTGMGSAPFNVL